MPQRVLKASVKDSPPSDVRIATISYSLVLRGGLSVGLPCQPEDVPDVPLFLLPLVCRASQAAPRKDVVQQTIVVEEEEESSLEESDNSPATTSDPSNDVQSEGSAAANSLWINIDAKMRTARSRSVGIDSCAGWLEPSMLFVCMRVSRILRQICICCSRTASVRSEDRYRTRRLASAKSASVNLSHKGLEGREDPVYDQLVLEEAANGSDEAKTLQEAREDGVADEIRLDELLVTEEEA